MNVTPPIIRRGWAIVMALATALVLLMQTPQARAEVVYGITGAGIYSVDSITGGPAFPLVAFSPAIAPNEAVTLATRPSDGMLFYLDSRSANPNLWRWDPANPANPPVLVGTPGATTTSVIRLGFDAMGNLYAMNGGAGVASIWTLNPNTGGILSVTPASGYNGGVIPAGGDLCLHPSTGVLYMIDTRQLYTITPAGVITQLGTITGLQDSSRGCAFDRDGQLFVSQDTALYKVDIGTLAVTSLVNIGLLFGDLGTNPDPNVRADLRVSKTADNLTPGKTVSFTVTVTNDGPNRATDVRVLDALPAGLTFTSATVTQGSYSTVAVGNTPAGTWRVGVLNNGETATLTINANVTGTAPMTNWAQVSYADQYDPDSTPGSAVPPTVAQDDQASVTITPSPDLQVVKTATSSFAVGTNATYSITVNNTLGSLTTGTNAYTVVDPMPTGLTIVGTPTGPGWNCAASTSTQMSCTRSTAIAAGASNPNAITLTVLPSAAAAPSVSNTATVSGGGEPASNNGNNSSTISTPVCIAGGCPDLILSKTSTATFTVGSNATYALTVSNIGGLPTNAAITVTDQLPPSLTYVSAAGAGWTCSVAAAVPPAGQVVTCTRPAGSLIAVGSPATPTSAPAITLTVAVTRNAAPSVTNTASVSGGGEPVSTQGNNDASLTMPVTDFDLIVTKTSPATFQLGVNAAYTITVRNVGSRVTSGIITVTDTLPPGLTFVSGTGTNWTCTASGQVVTCTRPAANTIAAGTAAAPTSAPAITLNVAVGAAAAPEVTNTARVSNPNESDNLRDNNESTVTTPVAAPDLVVTKSHNGNFTVGTNGVYTLTVSNIGGRTTSTAAVVVTDTLPAGLTYVSGTGTNWTCAAAGQVVTCTRPVGNTIAANSSAPPIILTVSVTAAAAAASPVVNSASVAGGNEPAGNANNNSVTDSTDVFYAPVIAKVFSPDSFQAGISSTLTFTISNPSGNPAPLAGLSFVDPFPAGMTVASGSVLTNTCGGTVSGSTQGDNLFTLTGGSTGGGGTSCQISLQVTSTTVGNQTNTTGQVSSSNSGTGNMASATFTVTAPTSPTLTMVSSPDPVGVNRPVTLTYTINNSAGNKTNLGFIHNFPVVNGAQMVYQSTVSNTCTRSAATPAPSLTNPAGTALVAGTSTGIRLFNGYDPLSNSTCVIVVTATVGAVGVVTTTNGTPGISGLTGSTVLVSTVNDTFNVVATTLTKDFSPATIAINATSLLTFTLTNGDGNPEQGGTTPINNRLAFIEALPANVVVASPPVATQCNGTVVAVVNTGTITFSGGTLSLGQTSCTISVNVRSATAGTYNNLPANVTGYASNIVNNATATLIVAGPPSLLFMKTAQVTRDPVNGVSNPKNIPGAEVVYSLRVTNTGTGTVDNNSMSITDPIPAGTELFVDDLGGAGTGPMLFVNGSPISGLGWTYTGLNSMADDVDFSSDGGLTWTYVPTPPYDPAVNSIRLNPKGTMAGASGLNQPYFELRFRVRIK